MMAVMAPDVRLVEHAQRGDAGARDRLLEEAYRRVFRYLLRLTRGAMDDAQELAHETMLRVVRSLETLKDPSRFVPWVLTIAANAWRDDRRRTPESALPADVPAPAGGGDRDGADAVLRHVDALPEPYRAAVVLRYVEGLDYDAMEEVLRTPGGTLRSHVARGLRMIRESIERTGP
jgi:RNA polymerase sigma-70 factor (ECF subfamily)